MLKFGKKSPSVSINTSAKSGSVGLSASEVASRHRRRLRGLFLVLSLALVIGAAVIAFILITSPYKITHLKTGGYSYRFKFFKDAKLEDRKKGGYSQTWTSPSNGGISLMAWPKPRYHFANCIPPQRVFSVKPKNSEKPAEVCKSKGTNNTYYRVAIEDSKTKEWHSIWVSTDLASDNDAKVQKIINSFKASKD